jgi:hypothetical protein
MSPEQRKMEAFHEVEYALPFHHHFTLTIITSSTADPLP